MHAAALGARICYQHVIRDAGARKVGAGVDPLRPDRSQAERRYPPSRCPAADLTTYAGAVVRASATEEELKRMYTYLHLPPVEDATGYNTGTVRPTE
jgi:hypothetical protein